jgi:hypothetical protein
MFHGKPDCTSLDEKLQTCNKHFFLFKNKRVGYGLEDRGIGVLFLAKEENVISSEWLPDQLWGHPTSMLRRLEQPSDLF